MPRISWSRLKPWSRSPKGISWEEAAGIGVPFVTAMEGLRRAGIPKAGETVLVMGVNGKVGQAATQIATWHGARVIGVVRKGEPYEGHANSQVEVIDASATDVAARVRELTGGKGADIVFNTVGDPYFEAAHKSLGVARAADPDRRGRPHRAVQHPGVLSRPAHLRRHRYARPVVGRDRRGACGNSAPASPADISSRSRSSRTRSIRWNRPRRPSSPWPVRHATA